MKKTRILIIDDHPLVRKGLRNIIDKEHNLTVCCEAASHQEAVKMMAEKKPDFSIIDLSLGDGNGLDLIRRASVRYPNMLILVCSMHDDTQFLERSRRAGAHGFINKHQAGELIIFAIQQIIEGKTYPHVESGHNQSSVPDENENQDDTFSIKNLSNRELEVFELIGKGMSTKEIADSLYLSVKTIGSHRDNIKTKLNLHSGSELICSAVRWING